MFLQPPIILVVPGSTVPNLVHIDSGEDDDYDNENYGDHTAICRHRLVAMSNLRSPTSYVHIAHDQKNVKPNKTIRNNPGKKCRHCLYTETHMYTACRCEGKYKNPEETRWRMPANYKKFGSFPGCRFTICLKYIHFPFCLSHVCTFSLYGDEGILMCKPHTWAC